MKESELIPDSKVRGANMGPTWGRQDPGGLHVGPMNLAIRDIYFYLKKSLHHWNSDDTTYWEYTGEVFSYVSY